MVILPFVYLVSRCCLDPSFQAGQNSNQINNTNPHRRHAPRTRTTSCNLFEQNISQTHTRSKVPVTESYTRLEHSRSLLMDTTSHLWRTRRVDVWACEGAAVTRSYGMQALSSVASSYRAASASSSANPPPAESVYVFAGRVQRH